MLNCQVCQILFYCVIQTEICFKKTFYDLRTKDKYTKGAFLIGMLNGAFKEL